MPSGEKLFLGVLLLFIGVAASAQTAVTPASVQAKLIFEKAYLHTDRDVYTRGDTLWYKAYLVNAQNNAPLTSSGNLYVDLISPDAKVISTELIRLDKGLGNGDFTLTDTLAPGKYRLRAYTNWMRNFGDNFVLDREITMLGGGGLAVGGEGKEKVAAALAVPAARKESQKKSATATKG